MSQSNFWQDKYIQLERQYKQTVSTLTDMANRHDKMKTANQELVAEIDTIRQTIQQMRVDISQTPRPNIPDDVRQELLATLDAANKEIASQRQHIQHLSDKLTLATLMKTSVKAANDNQSHSSNELASTIQERNTWQDLVIEAVRELTGQRMSSHDAFYELLPHIRKLKKQAA